MRRHNSVDARRTNAHHGKGHNAIIPAKIMRKTYSNPDPEDCRAECGSNESPTYGEDCPALVNIAAHRSREFLFAHTDGSCGLLWCGLEGRLYEQDTALQYAIHIYSARENWVQCEIECIHFHGVHR